MRVIALEEHLFPADVAAAAGLDLGLPDDPRTAALVDVGPGRIAAMDAAGVDVQVLSCVSHTVQAQPPVRAVDLARRFNDRTAAVVDSAPDRYRAFACLPMSAPSAAADELKRAVTDLGFVGAMIFGPTGGVFLDDPAVRPVLAAAQELEVPVYLHPAPPPPAVFAAYFGGLDTPVADALATAGWGWHAECGLHVLRMVAAGVFEELPGLQVVVGHMGENLPFSLARAHAVVGAALHHRIDVAATVRSHVHVTTCGYETVPPLVCALAVFGADRVLFSVDHPYGDGASATAFLRDAPLSPGDRALVAHRNAERLLRI